MSARSLSNRKRSTSRNAGFTLIEMVTFIGLVGVVMTTIAVTISSLHQLNRKLREEYPAAAAVSSLGLHLRVDVHAARKAQVVSGDHSPTTLQLTLLGEGSIEYVATDSRIVRQEKQGAEVRRREVYNLPKGSNGSWSVHDGETRSMVTLTLVRRLGKLPDARDDSRVIKITSVVGLDHVGLH